MILGFSGTRDGLNPTQLFNLDYEIERARASLFLHGGAEGADEHADQYASHHLIAVEVYPCTSTRYHYWAGLDDEIVRAVHTPRPPLVRNKIIAQRCARLIATPSTNEETLRSGTWATIRYAKREFKRVTIIFPDGRVVEE